MKLNNIFEVLTNLENSLALFLGFSSLALLTFGARYFFLLGGSGGCSEHYKLFSGISDLHTLDVSSMISSFQSVKTKNASRYCQMSSGGKIIPLRITVLGQ